MIIRSMWDEKSPDEYGQYESVSSEILTIPDQSLSVKDILRRFTSGTLSPEDLENKSMIYDDDPDIDDADLMYLDDITDLDDRVRRGNEIRDQLAEEAKIRALRDISAETNSEPDNEA